jgi:sulfite dehydrogenase (cytochrome) subunit B
MRTLLALLMTGAVQWAAAGEESLRLKDAPGRETVEGHCAMCHSLDYIPMNSPFLDRKGWEASVNKMIKAMGAPIGAPEAKAIVDYLSANYGK